MSFDLHFSKLVKDKVCGEIIAECSCSYSLWYIQFGFSERHNDIPAVTSTHLLLPVRFSQCTNKSLDRRHVSHKHQEQIPGAKNDFADITFWLCRSKKAHWYTRQYVEYTPIPTAGPLTFTKWVIIIIHIFFEEPRALKAEQFAKVVIVLYFRK